MIALPLRLLRAAQSCRRTVLLRRRVLAAICVGLSVWLSLRAVAGPPPPTTDVLVAAHDLPAGLVLTDDDLSTRAYARGTEPAGLIAAGLASGRTLAAPLRAGEPLTDVRLVAPGLLQGYPGLVAVPLRIPDPDTVSLLRVGDRIDVLATDPAGGGTTVVAHGVPVLALPQLPDEASSLGASAVTPGRLVVVGATVEASAELADASARRFLTVIWSR